MSSSDSPNFSQYGVETSTISAAPGVSLSSNQKLLTGCVLDLFAGKPSKRKLTLWTDNATFTDPITIANGRGQYEAQWYGLKAAFSQIEQLHAQVTSAGNPIEIDLKNKYTVAGVGAQQTIDSKVLIHTSADGSKVEQVEDKWNGSLPNGAFANVSLLSPQSWIYYGSSWTYWVWRNYVVEFKLAGLRPWDVR